MKGRTLPKFSRRGFDTDLKALQVGSSFYTDQESLQKQVSMKTKYGAGPCCTHFHEPPRQVLKPSLRPNTALKGMLSSWVRTPEVHQPRAPAREQVPDHHPLLTGENPATCYQLCSPPVHLTCREQSANTSPTGCPPHWGSSSASLHIWVHQFLSMMYLYFFSVLPLYPSLNRTPP